MWQWKPPSFNLVPTGTTVSVTLKSSHFGKRPYAWNQIRTTFSGPSVSKILRVGRQGPPGHDIVPLPVLHNPSNVWPMGLKSLFYRKDWGHTLYDKQLGAWIPHYLVGCTLNSSGGLLLLDSYFSIDLTLISWSVVAERSSLPDSSSGVSNRMWVRIPAVTLVSLSKTLNHNCFSPPRG